MVRRSLGKWQVVDGSLVGVSVVVGFNKPRYPRVECFTVFIGLLLTNLIYLMLVFFFTSFCFTLIRKISFKKLL